MGLASCWNFLILSSIRILSHIWDAAEAESAQRKRNAAQILEYIHASQHVDSVNPPPGSEAGYLRLPIIASKGFETRLTTKEAKRLGVMPGYPTALVDLPGFANRCVNREEHAAGARTLASRLFTVPTHSKLSPNDLSHLKELLLG